MDILENIDRQSHLHPFTNVAEGRPASHIIERAQGVWIFDRAGRTYLDALAGLWCVNVGYGNPHIVDAISQASSRLSFAHTFMGVGNEAAIRLSDRLINLSRVKMRKAFFGNSGSDANDTNLKLARLFHLLSGGVHRTKFIARRGGYHGTTLATSSLSGLPEFHRSFGRPESTYLHISAPDIYTALNGAGFGSEEQYADSLVAELEAVILREGPETIAAFVAEPVMAVGGVLHAPRTYFAKVKQVLDKYGILLIIDDVVCSFGRLGHWFGWETIGVVPDLVSIAKGLTSGYIPMSASIIGDRVWHAISQHAGQIGTLGHGFTTSGHPVAAAAALANIDVIEGDGLLNAAKSSGEDMLSALRQELGGHRLVTDIRGVGLLIGVELAADRATLDRYPGAGGLAATVATACLARGLIVRALPGRDVIALSPPLNISESERGMVIERFSKALGDVTRDRGRDSSDARR